MGLAILMTIIFVAYSRFHNPIFVPEGVAVDSMGGHLLDDIRLDMITNSIVASESSTTLSKGLVTCPSFLSSSGDLHKVYVGRFHSPGEPTRASQ